MKTKYILILSLFFFPATLLYSQVSIYLKPSAVLFFPSSDNLSGYYDKENIITYGGEVDFTTDFYGLGGYFLITRYKVNIHDENQIGTSWDEKSTIISFGLLKSFETNFFAINVKAGLSIHNDGLALGEDNARHGFRIGADSYKMISSNIGISLGIDYDYNKLTVPDYRTFVYSRHNAYFSGATLSTGGIFISAGIIVQIL